MPARGLNAAELARLPQEVRERLQRQNEEDLAEWKWHAEAPARERAAQLEVTRRARERHDACLLAVEAALGALPRVATFVGALPGRDAVAVGALLAEEGEDALVRQSLLLERRRLLGDPLTATGGTGLFWAGVLVGLGALIERTDRLAGSLTDLGQEVTGLGRLVSTLHEQVVTLGAGAHAQEAPDGPQEAPTAPTERDPATGRFAGHGGQAGTGAGASSPQAPPKNDQVQAPQATQEEGAR